MGDYQKSFKTFSAMLKRDMETRSSNQLSEDNQVTQPMSVYDGCGKAKTCIGIPSDCVLSENCVSFGAVTVKDGRYSFEMQTSGKRHL